MITKATGGELRIPLTKQTDSSYVIKNDGTIEASLTFAVDTGNEHLLPAINDKHPDDARLECYNKAITYGNLGMISCVCSYFGIAAALTSDPTFDYQGGTSSEPIETHARFDSFAGTSAAPKNGAVFEDDGSFKHFAGADAGTMLGVQYYLTPAVNVSVSYWTTVEPNLGKRMTIYKEPEIGKDIFKRVPNVKNYLLVDMPYRRVGNLYQVTEQYMGSGSRGFNETIYKKAQPGQ